MPKRSCSLHYKTCFTCLGGEACGGFVSDSKCSASELESELEPSDSELESSSESSASLAAAVARPEGGERGLGGLFIGSIGLEGSGLRTWAVEVVAAAEILMEDSDSES